MKANEQDNGKDTLLRRWLRGEADLTEEAEKLRPIDHTSTVKPKKHYPLLSRLAERELRVSQTVYAILSVIFCTVIVCVLIATAAALPEFGSYNTPTVNEPSEHYIEQGREETGAVNLVAGMILDYRAFDTLGESFVLFTATCAVILLMQTEPKKKHVDEEHAEIVNYKDDVVIRTAIKVLIPVILTFGVCILFCGHLSPGGGFSGGTILGAAFILYAMVHGTEKASRILTPGRIKVVTVLSLSAYCILKGYSFFTGNEFNGVHSVITPGTPGDLISGGLILPLNIAVGLVVACTMYSLYMLFRRGKI